MSNPIPLSPLIQLIKVCMKKAEAVRSNKETCAVLADDLGIVYDILSGLHESETTSADKFRFSRVMSKLRRITTRSNVLFDRCLSGQRWIRIRHFLAATSIKSELKNLQGEVAVAIGMLSLVFHFKQSSAYTKGGTAIPVVDDSVFNDEEEESATESEEYYLDEEEAVDNNDH